MTENHAGCLAARTGITPSPQPDAAPPDPLDCFDGSSQNTEERASSPPPPIVAMAPRDSFERAIDGLALPLVLEKKGSTLLPLLNTTPATPLMSPSRVAFTLSPDEGPDDEMDLPQLPFLTDGATLDRSTSMQFPLSAQPSPPDIKQSCFRKRCKSLPSLPPEAQVELVRQFSEAALDESFGSALRLNAHRMNLKIEQRYQALLELALTERNYVADLQILVEVYLRNLEELPSLTVAERAMIRRNGDAVWHLHQTIDHQFSSIEEELRWQSNHAPGSITDDSRVLDAVVLMANFLERQAPAFSVYEYYCARHSEATSLLRKASENQIEWDNYISHCLMSFDRLELPFTKLDVQDFAIKPVQRICRYPLMLNQLAALVNEQLPTEQAAAQALKDASKALQAMVGQVNAAERSFASQQQSARISNRLQLPDNVHAAFPNILGQCLLVGALYYLEWPPNEQIPRTRYYGAFLFATHLLLVKVKRQDCYEIRQVLPIRVFTVESIQDEEAFMPFAFRLRHGPSVIELAATNPAEKRLWCQRLNMAIDARNKAWIAEIKHNPVDPPFIDIDISSIPVDTSVVSSAESSVCNTPNLESVPLPPMQGTPSAKKSRFGTSFLGRAPSGRAATDARLADIMSEECSTARVLADREAAGIPRTKFASMSMRPRTESHRSTPQSGAMSRSTTLRDSLRRRSFINDKPGLNNFHRRRSSADVIMHVPEAVEAGLGSHAQPNLQRRNTSVFPGRTEGGARLSRHWTMRSRTMSTCSNIVPQDFAILGNSPATVDRNGSSSSTSSSIGLVASPMSSAPSSPLMTPKDLPSGSLHNLFNTLTRRKSKMLSVSPLFVPSLGSPEQDALALEAHDYLYESTNTKAARWSRWGSSTSLNSSSRQSSHGSLKGFFFPGSNSPPSSNIMIEDASAVLEGQAAQAESAVEEKQVAAPVHRSSSEPFPVPDVRKRKLFRSMMSMTSLPNVDR